MSEQLSCYPCSSADHLNDIKVIEWPAEGYALKGGGWWVVNESEHGYTPLAGPFKTRHRYHNVPAVRGAQDAYDFMVWGWL